MKMENFISDIHELIMRAENASDPRVKDWPLVQHISSPLLAVFCYVTIVLFGPKIMKTRQPFELKPVMAFYNFLAVLLSSYIFLKLVLGVIKAKYNLICQKIDYSFDKPEEMEIASALWWFYASKYFEILDTVFFVLRKKNNQVSFLHVYHHSSVLMLWWLAAKWLAGGSSFVPAGINSFVHIVMYTYYGLSIFPSLRKYLWWKKYLTQFQMIQFCALFIYGIVIISQDCGFPKYMAKIAMIYLVTLLLLFAKFYSGAYIPSNVKGKNLKSSDRPIQQLNGNNNLQKID